jgi:alpha-galactosidase
MAAAGSVSTLCSACLTGSQARSHAHARSGLRAAGYVYVNLDCGWTSGHRDAAGLQVNKTAFPSMEGLIDKVHSLGMKFGM